MPTRTITADGVTWKVFPSGFITTNVRDEFGLFFVSGAGAGRVVRVTRYSPRGSRSREQSLAELSDAQLSHHVSNMPARNAQPSATSPEAGYAP